ncbi:hypothetical protein OTERR_16470 [Oryzomicrobium terrae]|uniref:HTH lysR-type domain-containing protein n=1 Tax=Oryzomicrobium terrae TaxID=1735038 RepID=A0A5C1E8B7_9RHOO|nr:LysR family transcriptional regulator [Oryzomicrobium terrae]QEL65123.1 hypothetical protein OTERR_16470 [Oryzomicrobium terrae]
MDDIYHGDFRRLDLNLLVAFDALIQERSVSRAAARLYVGQPAMSHALGRLRELFGDELLFRSGTAMEPTRRALEIAARVRPLLQEALAVTAPGQGFSPAKARAHVKLAMSDPLEAILLPGLIGRLRERAPGITLAVQPLAGPALLDALDVGQVALAVGFFPQVRDTHLVTPLHDVTLECLHAPQQIALPANPSLDEILACPHLHTTYIGEFAGLFDNTLKQLGKSRSIVARTASPLAIPFVLAQTPLVAVLPGIVTRLFRDHSRLRIDPVPIDGLMFSISLVRHRRDRHSPLLDFIEQQLHEVVEETLKSAF